MANKTLGLLDVATQAAIPVRYIDNGDGSFSPSTTPQQGSVARVNAGSIAPGQTLKTFNGKVALSATATVAVALYTVTVGKTFYITDIYLSGDTSAVMDVQVQGAGATIFRAAVKGDTAPLEMTGIESQPAATSGQAVTILWPITAGPPSGFYYIAGFEQ